LEIVVLREEVGLKGSKNIDVFLLDSKIGIVLEGDNLDDIVIGTIPYEYRCRYYRKGISCRAVDRKGYIIY
jgi:hypothetical protein